MQLILFYGIRRSGNHGILNMFLKGLNNFVHINDSLWDEQKFMYYLEQPITFRIIDRSYTGMKNADNVIISIEDTPPTKPINSHTNTKQCILIRHPWNNLASLWKTYNNDTDKLLYYKNKWIEYANFILNNHYKYTIIIYDLFYKNKNYRLNVLNSLGIQYNEEYLHEKPGWAKSSFPQKVTILDNEFNRYLNFKHDTIFQKNIIQDTQLTQLWEKILNQCKETF